MGRLGTCRKLGQPVRLAIGGPRNGKGESTRNDVTEVRPGLYMSRALFPKLSQEMHRVSLVRSMRAPELIHFNGQYHTQTSRALNVAIAREIPAFGSVIAHELEPSRRDADTFPTYVSTNLTKARAGSIGCGFFPTRSTGLDLDPMTVFEAFGGDMGGANKGRNI